MEGETDQALPGHTIQVQPPPDQIRPRHTRQRLHPEWDMCPSGLRIFDHLQVLVLPEFCRRRGCGTVVPRGLHMGHCSEK